MEREITSRQKEILQLFADGFSTKEIAARLGICSAGIDSQVYRARARLTGIVRRPVRSREDAVSTARDLGLIE